MPTTPRPSALLCAFALLAVSCGAGRTFHDKQMDFGSVRSVAVLPLGNLSRDNLAGERVRDVLANMLLATGTVYVIPIGEVQRGLASVGVGNPPAPAPEEVVKLGSTLKVEAVLIGTIKEYGEVRSGTAVANVISMSLQMMETTTGRIVWSGASTKGGVGFGDRLLGGGGKPMNEITEDAVRDLLDQLLD